VLFCRRVPIAIHHLVKMGKTRVRAGAGGVVRGCQARLICRGIAVEERSLAPGRAYKETW